MNNTDDVLLVMGSHRQNGNTAYFIKELSEQLTQMGVKHLTVDVNQLKIDHCLDCAYCKNNFAKCVFDDDMNDVYEALRTAKVVVFASPVYFNGVTSKLKTLVDRCQMIFLCDFGHKTPFVSSVDREEKHGYIVSFGGANAYEQQFIGNEITLDLVYRNLRMPLREHLKYSNTDRQHVSTSEQATEDIRRLATEIEKEVKHIER